MLREKCPLNRPQTKTNCCILLPSLNRGHPMFFEIACEKTGCCILKYFYIEAKLKCRKRQSLASFVIFGDRGMERKKFSCGKTKVFS
jgi:hypothetical protein